MTPSDEITALRAEMLALRRRVRVLMVLTGAALVLAILLSVRSLRGLPFLAGSSEARAEQMEAQQYRLLDPKGNLRGLWACPPAGPSLILLDELGRPAIEIRQLPDGGGELRVRDARGEVQFQQP